MPSESKDQKGKNTEAVVVGGQTELNTFESLRGKDPVTVAFPPCAGELLPLIKTTSIKYKDKDDIVRYFDDYFRFGRPHVIIRGVPFGQIDQALLNCGDEPTTPVVSSQNPDFSEWLSDCCLCPPCLTLDGIRNPDTPPKPDDVRSDSTQLGIRRLFLGDVVWLHFVERMGVFQILGAILDSYAYNGRLPISNGSIESGPPVDDIVALTLEVMTRQMKMGTSSIVRDRACLYRTVLGWTSEPGRKLNLDTNVNTGFSNLFHNLIYYGLQFFRDRRLAFAIQTQAVPDARPSVATLSTISDTIDVLKRRFEPFAYGRNYNNTLSGIVWAIAAMSVIRALSSTLGIPPAFNTPDEFIPAAYDILVLKRPVTSGETNRYLINKDCAEKGRDILLDLEVIDHKDSGVDGQLEQWLNKIEPKIESYRTAYQRLTGVDLGASITPAIDQQA